MTRVTTPPGPPPPPPPPPGSYPGPPQGSYPPPPQGSYPPPPPPPPAPYSDPSAAYYAPPPKKSRKALYTVLGVVAALVLVLVGGGTLLYLLVGKGTVTATDVKVGDCLRDIPGDTKVLTVQTVACDQTHAGEVFAVLLMPEGDFPGQPAIDDYADKCSPELAAYSPEAMLDDSVQMYVLYPTAETWAEGDRAVTCIATLDPPRSGSLKG
ncbi:Septum formation [Mycolicibacterium rutilum]|uniref:Septum formation n=1 Tax=Mycolicibacterium rutilum TaxID=370526 RepID=A0A1H6INR1_MYCRU|nr:Septum formation [Mycolicibacterium rutilum]